MMVSCRLGRLKCFVVNITVHRTSEAVSLAFPWTTSRTYRYNLGKSVLKTKVFNGCEILQLLVGLSGPILMKKSLN